MLGSPDGVWVEARTFGLGLDDCSADYLSEEVCGNGYVFMEDLE